MSMCRRDACTMTPAAAVDICRADTRLCHVQRSSSSSSRVAAAAGSSEAAVAVGAAAISRVAATACRAGVAARRGAAAAAAAEASADVSTAAVGAPASGATAAAAGILGRSAAAAAFGDSATREAQYFDVKKDAWIFWMASRQHRLSEDCLFRRNSGYQSNICSSLCSFAGSLSSTADVQKTAASGSLATREALSSSASVAALPRAAASLSSRLYALDSAAPAFYSSCHLSSVSSFVGVARFHPSDRARDLPCAVATAVPAADGASSLSASSFSRLPQQHAAFPAAVLLRLSSRLSLRLPGGLRILNEALQRPDSPAAAEKTLVFPPAENRPTRTARRTVTAASAAAVAVPSASPSTSAAAEGEKECAAAAAAAPAAAAARSTPSQASGSRVTDRFLASPAFLSGERRDSAAGEWCESARDSSHSNSRRTISSNAGRRENSSSAVPEDRISRGENSGNEWKLSSAGRSACCVGSGALTGTRRTNSRSRSSRKTCCHCRRSSSSSSGTATNVAITWRERNSSPSSSNRKEGNSSSSRSRSRNSSKRSESDSTTQSNSMSLDSNGTWIYNTWSSRRLERENSSSKRRVEEPSSQDAFASGLGESMTCDRHNSGSSSTLVSADGQTQRLGSCSASLDCGKINTEQQGLLRLANLAEGEASSSEATLSTATSSRLLLLSSPLARAAGRRKTSSRHACSRSFSLLQHLLLFLLLLWECEAERIWASSAGSCRKSAYSSSNSSSMDAKSPLPISDNSSSSHIGRQAREQPPSWLRSRHVDAPLQRGYPSLLFHCQSRRQQQSLLPSLPHTTRPAPSTSAPSRFPAAIVPVHTSVFPAAAAPAPQLSAAEAAAAVDPRFLCSQASREAKPGGAAAAGGCWTAATSPAVAPAWRAAATAAEATAGAAEKPAASVGKAKTSRSTEALCSSNSSSLFLETFRCPRYNSKRWMNAYIDGWRVSGLTSHGGNFLSVADAAAAARGGRLYLPAAVSAAVGGSTSSPAQQQRHFATRSNEWLLLLPSSDASAGPRPYTSVRASASVGRNGASSRRSSKNSSSVSRSNLRDSSVVWGGGFHSNSSNSNSSKFKRSSSARRNSSSSDSGGSSGVRRTPPLISRRGGSCWSRRPSDARKSSSRTQLTRHCSPSEEKSEPVDEEADVSSPIDLFEMLGVARDASAAEIEKGYQQASRQVAAAGDGGCPALAEMVEAAYAVLRDERLKKKYEATGCIPKHLHASFQAVEAMASVAGSASTSSSEEEAAAGVTGRRFGEGKFQRREAEADLPAAEHDDEAAADDEEAEEATDDTTEEASNHSTPRGLGGVLSSFFSRGLSGGSSSKRQQPGEDVWTDVQLLLSEVACRSVEKDIKVSVMRRCSSCRGTGAAGAAKPIPCDSCNGQGVITQVKRMQMGVLQSSHTCGSCGGSGIKPREVCPHCGGEGRKRVEEILQVSIPAGVADGTTLTLRGRGDVGVAGGSAGDLLLNVEVTNDTPFRREGNNLLSIAKISYPDAVLGLPQKEVQVIDGTARVSIQPGTHSGDKIVIEGRGAVDATAVAEQEEVERKSPERKIVTSPLKRGDHIVVVEIEVPDAVTADERRLLERLRELQHAKVSSH